MFGRKKKRQGQQEPERELYKPHQFKRGGLRMMARDAILAEREKHSTFQTQVRAVLFDAMVRAVKDTGTATLSSEYIEKVCYEQGRELGISHRLIYESTAKEKIAEIAHLSILPFIDDGFYAYRYIRIRPEKVRDRSGIWRYVGDGEEITFWKVTFSDQEIQRDESRYETKRLSGPRGLGLP